MDDEHRGKKWMMPGKVADCNVGVVRSSCIQSWIRGELNEG